MEGESEDDCEVVLKDSELYKYLLQCNTSDFDVYDKSDNIKDKDNNAIDAAIKASLTKVPTEFLKYIDIILNSNILLDEDVTYLYGFTIDLISDHQIHRFRNILLSSLIGVCSFFTAVKYNGLIGIEFLMKPFSTVNNYYIKWCRTQSLLRLIFIVKQLHLYFKKTLRILFEENAYFKLQQLKSKSNNEGDDFAMLEKKKKIEVESLSAILSQCILENIISTRNTTKCLVLNLPLLHHIDSKNHYLAFMTDQQLGISNFSEDKIGSSSNSSLDTLKNIYLLMQSEFFRRLGLSFCPTLWKNKLSGEFLDDLFQIIQTYAESCENILSVIQFYYKKHISPKTVSTQKLRNPVLVDGYSCIHKINSSLSELMSDSRILEEYVENINNFNDNEVNNICFKLESIKNHLNKSIENIINAEKFFIKLKRVKEVKNEIADGCSSLESQPVIKKIEVGGKAHNDIDSKDHLYFTISDGKQESDSHEDNIDFEPVKLPNFILTELKEALIEKRNEFKDRENKAIENQEEYKKFLETPDINEEKKPSIKYDLPQINPGSLQMQKNLANAIAQKSVNFMAKNEEQFGSSDDSDSSPDISE